MKKRTLKTDIEIYDSADELSEQDQKILALAHKSVEDAYAPYSKFKVGAAILLNNGELIGGSNQENAAYPVCICAERVALSAAASRFPKEAIRTIAITAKSHRVQIKEPISPCGTCRQFMCEVEIKHQQAIRVILQGETGSIYIVESAKDLLPLSFDSSFL